MRRDRPRSAFALLLFLSAGFFWILWGRPQLELWLRPILTDALSRAAGQPVTLTALRIHPLLLSVEAYDVRVGPPLSPVFSCRRWTFRTALAGSPSPFSWLFLTFGRSDLEAPVVRLGPSGEPGKPLALPGAWWRGLPRHELRWTEGRLLWRGGPEEFRLESVSGSLGFSLRGAALRARGRGDPGEWRLSVDAAEADRESPSLKGFARLELPEANLDFLTRVLPARAGGFRGRAAAVFEAEAARLDVLLRAKTLAEVSAAAKWSLEINARDATWIPHRAGRPPDGVIFDGTVRLDPHRLTLRRVKLWKALGVNGYLEWPIRPAGAVDLEWQAEDLSLEVLRRSGLPAAELIALSGRATSSGRFLGPWARPAVEGDLRLAEGRLLGLALPPLSAQGRWRDDWFKGDLKTWGGQVSAEGTLRAPRVGEPPTKLQWNLRAQGLDMAELSRANGWAQVGGVFGGEFSLVLPATAAASSWAEFAPRAEGAWIMTQFNWGGTPRPRPLAGRLALDNSGLRVSGSEGNFDVDLRREGAVWRLVHLRYAEPEGLSLAADGLLRGPDGEINLSARLDNLALRELPPIVKQFPQVEGAVAAAGAVTGAWGDPVFTGRLTAEDLRWRPGGDAHRADMELRGGRRHMRITRFRWDEAVEGEGTWLPARGWELKAAFHPSPVARTFDVFPWSRGLEGSLTGQISVSGVPGASMAESKGWAKLAWTDGKLGPVAFGRASLALFAEDGQTRLESLDVEQSSGAFRAQGLLTREQTPSGPAYVWSLDGDLRAFRWGGEWDGPWNAEGRWRPAEKTAEGALRSSRLWWRGAELGAVGAKLYAQPGGWGITDFHAAGGVTGEYRVQNGLAAGRLTARAPRWGSLFPDDWRLKPGENAGSLSAEAVFSGPWKRPRAELSFLLAGARWHGAPVEMRGDGFWEGETLTLKRFTAELPDGGAVTAQGAWSPPGLASATARGGLRLTADFHDIQYRALFPAESAQKDWDAMANGRLTASGPADAPLWVLEAAGTVHGGARTTTWTTRVRYGDREGAIEELTFKTPDGSFVVRPGARLVRLGAGRAEILLTADARNIHAGPLTLFGGVEFAGEWDGATTALEGRLRALSLWINQRYFDRDLAQARWTPGLLEFEPLAGNQQYLTGKMDLRQWPQVQMDNVALWEGAARRALLTGEIGPKKWDFELRGWQLEADILIGLANLDYPVTGRWNARVRGEGTPAAPRLTGEIRGRDGKVGPLPYDRFDAQVRWQGQRLDLENLRLSRGDGYLLTGRGQIPTRPEPAAPKDLSLQLVLSDGKLAVLKDMWPECRQAKGAFWGELKVEPIPGGTRTAGFLQVKDGRLSNRTYARRVSDLNVRLVLADDKLTVERAEAQIGKGRVVAAGSVLLDGLELDQWDIFLETKSKRGIALEIPQLSVSAGPVLSRLFRDSLSMVSHGEPTGFLRITGPHGAHQVSGEVTLENTQFTYPPRKRDRPPPPSALRDFYREANWDVLVKTGEDTQFRNEYVNVDIDGKMRILGRVGAWRPSGKVEANEGVISYLGQTFQVTQGAFEIVTETRPGLGAGTIPYLSGVAEKIVPGVDAQGIANDDLVTMVVDRAPLGEIQPRFISRNNPALGSERVAMRALGIAHEEQITQEDRDQLLRAGLVQLVGTSAAPLANRLAQRFGIYMITAIYEPDDTVEEDPTVPTGPSLNSSRDIAEYLRGAGAAARIRFTNRLFGVYKVKLDEQQNQSYFRDEIEIVYRLAKSLHVRASTELDSERYLGQAPDRQLFLENQWRFDYLRKRAAPGPATGAAKPGEPPPSPPPVLPRQ